MERSGSLTETNEYLGPGHRRMTLGPNPFADPNGSDRHELKLREGHVEITGRIVSLKATVRV